MTNEEYLRFIHDKLESIKSLIEKKNHDYTAGNSDALYNLRDAEDIGLSPMHGLILRMGDKFKRLKTFTKTGSLAVVGEGASDAFSDLIGYSLMGLALLEETQAKEMGQNKNSKHNSKRHTGTSNLGGNKSNRNREYGGPGISDNRVPQSGQLLRDSTPEYTLEQLDTAGATVSGRNKTVSTRHQEARRKPGQRRNPQARDAKSGKFRRSSKR